MTLALERPVLAGRMAIAAIARTEVLHHRAGCLGSKHAVALLIRREEGVQAFTPRGRRMSPEEVEALCPGALVRFLKVTRHVAS